MRDLVIFGAGDIARLAHFYFSRDAAFRVAGFTVDAAYRKADAFCGLPLIDFESVEAAFPPESEALPNLSHSYVGKNWGAIQWRKIETDPAASDLAGDP